MPGSPVPLVEVDPSGYDASSHIVGGLAADAVERMWGELSAALAGCSAMAGSDPAGVAWAAAYDPAARRVVVAMQDVLNGCLRLAELLERSGFNHGAAEAASTASGARSLPPDRAGYGGWLAWFPPPPEARGGFAEPPSGWSLIEHVVGCVWPNGHQDLLARAASGWSAAADQLGTAAYTLGGAVSSVLAQRSPEVADAAAACQAMQRRIETLAQVCSSLSSACSRYATSIDTAHSDAEHELVSLLEWTAGIEGLGLLGSLVTAGLSEGAAQAVEAARVRETAAAVTVILERVSQAADYAVDTMAALMPRTMAVSLELRPLLSARLVTGEVTDAGEISYFNLRPSSPGIPGVGDVARAERWEDPETLIDHFNRHARSLGCKSTQDYARQAQDFLTRARREGLPTKIDSAGTIRVWNPSTRIFGSYSPNGETYTYFRAKSANYWNNQKGVLQ